MRRGLLVLLLLRRQRWGLYPRGKLEPEEAMVHALRGPIRTAAERWAVSPEIVGAVLWDELERRRRRTWILDLLAGLCPSLAARADLSLGLPQIRPSLVAEARSAQGLPELDRATIVRQLLDPTQACDLLGLLCRHIIDLWADVYPDARLTGCGDSGARLIGTVYSIGCRGAWGVHPNPLFSRRGLAIAASMELVSELLSARPFQSTLQAVAEAPASRTQPDVDSAS